MKTWQVASWAFVLGLFLVPGPGRGASDPRTLLPPEGDFTGKIVWIRTKTGHLLLEKPQVKSLAGHGFLVGKAVKAGPPSAEKLPAAARVWVPLAEVVQILEFKDLDQFRRSMLAGRARTGERVEVLWGGTWWKAEVLERKDGRTKIHYTGYDKSSDEWVTPDRIRPIQQQGANRPNK